jgi:hypothetical protein
MLAANEGPNWLPFNPSTKIDFAKEIGSILSGGDHLRCSRSPAFRG